MVVSPSWLPFFLQNPLKNNAAHAITAGRKKRTQRNNASTKAAAQNAKNAAYAKTQDATHAATKARKNTQNAATKAAAPYAKAPLQVPQLSSDMLDSFNISTECFAMPNMNYQIIDQMAQICHGSICPSIIIPKYSSLLNRSLKNIFSAIATQCSFKVFSKRSDFKPKSQR